MSSKLLSGSEAALYEPMPWATGTSLERRSANQQSPPAGGARQTPMSGQRDATEELRSRIAALEQEISQARMAGRAEGEAHGRQQGQAELQAVLQKLAAGIHECGALRPRLREQAEADLVRLAIAVARRILGRELNTDPEAITGLVKASLQKLRVQEVVRVRLNPEQRSKVAEFLAGFGASNVEVAGDPACGPGTVVFETTRGNLDASVETQLREIERGLTDRFRGRGC